MNYYLVQGGGEIQDRRVRVKVKVKGETPSDFRFHPSEIPVLHMSLWTSSSLGGTAIGAPQRPRDR